MNLIVAVDENWGIGKDNKLLMRIPADMRFFKNTTIGKTVIMGRSTFCSIGSPLKDRKNIVLTTRPIIGTHDVTVYSSLSELFKNTYNTTWDSQFVIGGESVYRQLLDYCSYACVTKIHVTLEADRHFPNLDTASGWELIEQSSPEEYESVKFRFCTYKNLSVKTPQL